MRFAKVLGLVFLITVLPAAAFVAGSLTSPAPTPAPDLARVEAAADSPAPVPAPVMTKPADQGDDPPATRAARIDWLLAELDRLVTAKGLEAAQQEIVDELCRDLIRELKADRSGLVKRAERVEQRLKNLEAEAKAAANWYWATALVLLGESEKEEDQELQSLYRRLGWEADLRSMSIEEKVAKEETRLWAPFYTAGQDLEKAARALDAWDWFLLGAKDVTGSAAFIGTYLDDAQRFATRQEKAAALFERVRRAPVLPSRGD